MEWIANLDTWQGVVIGALFILIGGGGGGYIVAARRDRRQGDVDNVDLTAKVRSIALEELARLERRARRSEARERWLEARIRILEACIRRIGGEVPEWEEFKDPTAEDSQLPDSSK